MKIIEETYKWNGIHTQRNNTKYIILHHAAGEGSAQDIHRLHLNNGWLGIGYHYYIRRCGSIYRGRPESAVGAHTVGYNSASIGICFEGNFENEQMSQVQLEAGAELIADIKSRFNNLYAIRHKDADATACPGANFPLALMMELSAKGLDAQVQTIEPEQGSAPATDEPADEWALGAVEWAVQRGLFIGDERGSFNWKKPVNRQELAVILKRLNIA